MGMLPFLAVWPGGVPCWLEKGQGACALVVWVDSGVVHAVGFPDRQALVGGGVPFPPSWPCPLWGGCLGWCGVVV